MIRKFLLFFFFLATWHFLFTTIISSYEVTEQTTVQKVNLSSEMTISVSAAIGGYIFDLEGLTSPWAKVDFYSTEGNIEVSTIADDLGIFHFRSVMAPVQTGDFCFLSYDVDSIANNPLCFSPPPPNTKTAISGIILPPTISINKSLFRQNEPVESRGRTFPNAKIQIFVFEKERSWWQEFFDVIVPAVFAREGPKLEISADANGQFSFNLPTQKSTRWRIFAGPATEEGNQTAQSNILEFSALSWWQWALMTVLRWLLTALKTFFSFLFRWEVIVTLLLAIIGGLAVKIYQSRF